MNITLNIPEYNSEIGIEYAWQDNFEIITSINNGTINITANKEGLISLANHLLNLSQDNVPSGHHLHLDQYNSLEENSVDLIIQKKL
jgi:hypothetical protein